MEIGIIIILSIGLSAFLALAIYASSVIEKLEKLINDLKNGWKLCNSEDLETIQFLAICVIVPCLFIIIFSLTN